MRPLSNGTKKEKRGARPSQSPPFLQVLCVPKKGGWDRTFLDTGCGVAKRSPGICGGAQSLVFSFVANADDLG